jgi:hypothetical protein
MAERRSQGLRNAAARAAMEAEAQAVEDTPSESRLGRNIQRVARGVEAAVAPQASAARAAVRANRPPAAAAPADDLPLPPPAPPAPPSPPRGAARAAPRRSGGSRETSADDLNQISLDMARGQRMGPMAPGAEQNIAKAMGYSKGGRVDPRWNLTTKPQAR